MTTYAFTARPANTYNAPEGVTLSDVTNVRGEAKVAVGGDIVHVRYLGLATLSRDLTDAESKRYHIYPVMEALS